MSYDGHYLVVAITGGRDFTLGWFVRDRRHGDERPRVRPDRQGRGVPHDDRADGVPLRMRWLGPDVAQIRRGEWPTKETR